MNKIIFLFAAVFTIIILFVFLKENEPITNYPSDGSTIVAFGDSLVEGYGATEGNDFVKLLSNRIGRPIINLGRSGETTGEALERIDLVIENDPKVVMVLLGGNDFLKRVPEDEVFLNLEKIIDTIHQSGSTVILLGIRGGFLSDNFKGRFEDLAKEKNVAYISDVLDELIGKKEFMFDSIHPNDNGYSIIADRAEPVLKKLID